MLLQSEIDSLGNATLFKGLTPQEMARLGPLLRRRTVHAGGSIMSVDQPGEAVYIILSGTVKVHVEQPDGTEVILAILGPGETLGEMDMVDSLGRSASAVTLEETRLVWMDRASFQDFLSTMPALSHNLARILSRRLRLSNSQVQALAALDVYGRVARQLLALAREYGQPGGTPGGDLTIPFRLTQSELADMVGASRVRVNQVLVHYKEQGYISVDANYRITVHDQEALVSRCY